MFRLALGVLDGGERVVFGKRGFGCLTKGENLYHSFLLLGQVVTLKLRFSPFLEREEEFWLQFESMMKCTQL